MSISDCSSLVTRLFWNVVEGSQMSGSKSVVLEQRLGSHLWTFPLGSVHVLACALNGLTWWELRARRTWSLDCLTFERHEHSGLCLQLSSASLSRAPSLIQDTHWPHSNPLWIHHSAVPLKFPWMADMIKASRDLCSLSCSFRRRNLGCAL